MEGNVLLSGHLQVTKSGEISEISGFSSPLGPLERDRLVRKVLVRVEDRFFRVSPNRLRYV